MSVSSEAQTLLTTNDPTQVPDGYKRTEVGVIPEDWEAAEIGDLNPFVTSGSRGWARFYSNTGVPFIRITNLSRQSIDIDLFDMKFVALPHQALAEALRTEVQEGDVLISITADIGIIGYVNANIAKPAYMNQHVALIRFNQSLVSSRFAAYSLASERSQRRFIAFMDTGAKAGMSLLTVRKIHLVLPPLPEQRAIAAALADVDALIAALDALIAKKRDIKQATMQQLLTGKTRLPGFSGAWSNVYLRDLLCYERPDRYIVHSAEYSDRGEVPVLTANKSFILGYTSEDFGICCNLPVIVFDDFTTDNKYVDFPFKVKSSAIKLLRSKNDQVDLKFVFDRLQLIRFPLGDHKRYYISEYQNIELAVPKYKEQIAIATILSNMDAEIAALERRLDKTRQIKQGMMQQLLTGRIRLVHPEEAETTP